jgi:hypothetical protein
MDGVENGTACRLRKNGARLNLVKKFEILLHGRLISNLAGFQDPVHEGMSVQKYENGCEKYGFIFFMAIL